MSYVCSILAADRDSAAVLLYEPSRRSGMPAAELAAVELA